MINPDEERYILKQAWIPEHIPGLMAGNLRGRLLLRDPFVGLAGNDWLVFVGYPLRGISMRRALRMPLGRQWPNSSRSLLVHRPPDPGPAA
jgi:hypothetical protein